MKLFLARHAEGKDSNTVWQSPETPLSDRGKKQADALIGTHRFKNVEIILTSKLKRSQETSEIVANGFGKEIEVVDGIQERQQSSKIYGMARTNDVSERYFQDVVKNSGDWNWKWDSEEESFAEVINRAVQFREYLIKNYLKNDILVVSHDVFLRCFIAVCVLGENSDRVSFQQFYRSISIEKTGISLLIYREEQKLWKLWYLNDYAHLSSL